MADLIDRQAVQEMVDRIGGMYPYRQIGNRDSYNQYNEAWTDAINRVDAELNSLPSAQPVEKDINVPCKDTISRQDAIDALDNIKIPRNASWYPYYQQALTAMSRLPSSQPEPRWIPVTERLPDQYGNYLISIDGEEPDIGTINPNDPRGWSLCDANGFYWASDKALNITAWMPLPEPYTERRGNETD